MDVRVFDSYGFNIIDKVRFGLTKPYLERMLAELGLSYSQLGFSAHAVYFDKVFDRVLEKYPALKKYYYTADSGLRFLSSFSEDWRNGDVYADKEDWDDFSAVFSKVPRPFNIPFGNMIFGGIRWYGDSDDSIAVYHRAGRDRTDTSNPLFYSNRIEHIRSYDDGRKVNAVYVCIEATAQPEPRNTSDIIERLKPYLGEPLRFSRISVFPKEEIERVKPLMMQREKQLIHSMDKALPIPKQRTDIQHYHPPVPHITDVPTVQRAFADTGFERIKGTPNWYKLYRSTDSHGFRYDAYVQRLTDGYELRVWLEISGANFRINSGYKYTYYVSKEGESLEILRPFALFCAEMRDSLGEELTKDFGDTPLWHWAEL